ncbi:MAG: AAA family ATPase [archaeon]
MPKPLEIDERTLETKVRLASEQLERHRFFSNARLVSSASYHMSPKIVSFCHVLEQELGLAYAIEEKAGNYLGITDNPASRKKSLELNVYIANLISERLTEKLSRFIHYKGTEKSQQMDFEVKTSSFVKEMVAGYCEDVNRQVRETHVVNSEQGLIYITAEFFSQLRNTTQQRQATVQRVASQLEGMKLPDEKSIVMDSGVNGNGESSGYLVKDLPEDRYSDIGGLDRQLVLVKEVIELPLTKADKFREFGVKMPKGCIFYGPPGTGKTMTARAIANETDSSFFYVPGPDLRKKYVGVGGAIIKNLYDEAYGKRPSIIFIDEVDAIVQPRGSDTGRYTEEQTDQIMICIDGFKKLDGVATVFATNRVDLLDEALLNRFSNRYTIEFPMPDEQARETIFRLKLAKMKLGSDVEQDYWAKNLAKNTEGANGRNIDSIMSVAGINAIKLDKDAIYQEDLEYGLIEEGFENG